MEDKILRLINLQDKALGTAETFPLFEAFLLNEGMELLAAYRSISNPATRRCILDLVKAAAVKRTD